MEFKDWFYDEFIKWRGKTMASVTDFAIYLGYKQPVVSGWLNGRNKPSAKTLPRLANKLGNGIYSVMGLPAPDELESLPSVFLDPILAARREYTIELSNKGITSDTPEARQIIKDAFDRHGVKFTFTE